MRKLPAAVSLAAIALTGACTDDPTSPRISPSLSVAGVPGTYVVIGNGNALPADLARRVRDAGGEIASVHPEIGVAVARAASPAFAARLARGGGIESVTLDQEIQWVEPGVQLGDGTLALDAGAGVTADAVENDTPSIGSDEEFWPFQWAPRVVDAPDAWNAGLTGEGVRVAILDGAVYRSHLDIAANLDTERSASFYPGVDWDVDVGTFWHGTHVAGIVAAADNGIGTIGIAPKATLIGVKVLHNGSGPFTAIIGGIMYAARPISEGGAGAHVINMSLGATFDEKLKVQKAAVRELKKAIDRATAYAYQNGVTVIASAGNGATNFDDAKTYWKTPAQNQHVISVGATGPVDWARGATNHEQPAYYTDHGKSLLTLSAPGGNFALAAVYGDISFCTVFGFTNRCYAFDGVLSTSRGEPASVGNYSWAQGTSMAAPLVSGLAALVIQQAGGTLHPSQVRMQLEQAAIDLGKPGNDEWYGAGWVNAGRLVR